MNILFDYKGRRYPSYLRDGNAMQYIRPVAEKFCIGKGLDVGAGKWPLPGATPVEKPDDAMALPEGPWDYIFSSHCLEHLDKPVDALEHWKDRLIPGGTLFLYLPHPEMEYWRPQHCRKHLHSWIPSQMSMLLWDLGYVDVLVGGRDFAWSFAAVAFKPIIATGKDEPQ